MFFNMLSSIGRFLNAAIYLVLLWNAKNISKIKIKIL